MKKSILIVIAAAFCFNACTISRNTNPAANNQSTETPKAANPTAKNENAEKTTAKKEQKSAPKIDCKNVDTGDLEVWAKQTFPVDFAPYEKSCFVTAYNPEYDDPPLESEFAIYTDGEKAFDFPSQFNGVKFGCWVDAVAFEDLNDDDLKDITVIGKCSAKMGEYNENMVYVNTGRDFKTSEDANYKLADFSRAKEVNDFVRQNKNTFFK